MYSYHLWYWYFARRGVSKIVEIDKIIVAQCICIGIHGRRLFFRGEEECLKNCYTPKNGSRGRDAFCPPRGGVEGGRGGVEGGKGGGDKPFFAEENRDFCENMRKKSKDF